MKQIECPEIDGTRKSELAAFRKSCGIKFKNLRLLHLAFVHRSVSNETGYKRSLKQNNERLEFLGDAVLGAVTADILYTSRPQDSEGNLAKLKSVLVSAETLSGIARQLEMDRLLVLGHGEELSGGRTKKALLADALEAVFGALYLDSGYGAAADFVTRCIKPEIERIDEKRGYLDYKSSLQEESQRRFRVYPRYRLVERSGPEHERYFRVEVIVNDSVYGPGTGMNKKSAEQEAARLALEALNEKT